MPRKLGIYLFSFVFRAFLFATNGDGAGNTRKQREDGGLVCLPGFAFRFFVYFFVFSLTKRSFIYFIFFPGLLEGKSKFFVWDFREETT